MKLDFIDDRLNCHCEHTKISINVRDYLLIYFCFFFETYLLMERVFRRLVAFLRTPICHIRGRVYEHKRMFSKLTEVPKTGFIYTKLFSKCTLCNIFWYFKEDLTFIICFSGDRKILKIIQRSLEEESSPLQGFVEEKRRREEFFKSIRLTENYLSYAEILKKHKNCPGSFHYIKNII